MLQATRCKYRTQKNRHLWRVRGKTIRAVLCNIVCNNCAQCDAHTYEQTNSSLDWVLSHWAHFTVLRFIFVYVSHACVGLQHGEVDLVGLKPNLRTTTSFNALTLSVGSFDP